MWHSGLMERYRRVQNRDVLLNDVWSYDSVIDTALWTPMCTDDS
jgi:hypothetical protein